jgi:plasmid stabilization system protein ParE
MATVRPDESACWTSGAARLREESIYYIKRSGVDAASNITKQILAAIYKLKRYQGGHKVDGLPANYRRVNVDPFFLLYRVSKGKDYVLVLLLRHGKRKPLSPSTIKRLASEAERDS